MQTAIPQGSDRNPARRAAQEDTARVVMLTLASWSAAVAGAALDGVFARLGAALFVTLALFALAYALAAYGLDGGVRAWLERGSLRTVVAVSIALDLALGLGAWEAMRAGEAWPALLATLHGPLLVLVVAPLAVPCQVCALRALARRYLSSGPARSPGAKPAAT